MSGQNLGNPYAGYASPSRDPYPDALEGGVLRRHALAAQVTGERADPAELWAARLRTAWIDLVLDGDRLLGRPRGAVGFVGVVSGQRLAEWARTAVTLLEQQDMDAAAWDRAAGLLRDWVAGQQDAQRAATPADARRAAEISAEQRRAQRRAELEQQRADTDAELAALDASPAPDEPEQPRPGGWLRRSP